RSGASSGERRGVSQALAFMGCDREISVAKASSGRFAFAATEAHPPPTVAASVVLPASRWSQEAEPHGRPGSLHQSAGSLRRYPAPRATVPLAALLPELGCLSTSR